jgi:membrane protein
VLQIDVLQLEPVLEVLVGLEWVGQLVEDDGGQSRYILLADADKTLLEPLMQQLLLDKTDSTSPLWTAAQLPGLKLSQVL